MDDGLIMEQLKHEDELRTFEDVPLEVCDIADSEPDLAIKIIDQRVNEGFEPGKYEDEVRSRIMQLIEQKVGGQEIAMPPDEQPEARIIDLMEALKASVDGKSVDGKKTGTKKPAGKSAVKKAAPSNAVKGTRKAR
jgi:DNA end-binding protein Ku